MSEKISKNKARPRSGKLAKRADALRENLMKRKEQSRARDKEQQEKK